MAIDSINISSQALGLIRANPITSFTDGSNEAAICSLFYDSFVQDILTRYPWSFCTKKRKLNQDSTAPTNEFRYAHIVPAEALRVWAVFSSGSVGAVPIKEYDIQAPDGSRLIFSNYQELWCDYTYYVDEGYWPPYFIHFAIHAFGALIAKPVTDQDDMAARLYALAWGNQMEGERGGKFAVAVNTDALQKPGETISSSPLIEARFS